jgi:tripartite-type tricarboxylate transporter receptor subunit TctC
MQTFRIIRALALAATALPLAVSAQSYPAKTIRVIIPFPPGNTMDIMTRLIAPRLTERLGQNVIVDNRAGAAGQLGLDLTAKAPPDGYTIGGGQAGNLVMQPHTYKRLPYDAIRDFAPIAMGATNFLVLVVHPATQFKTTKDLISYARANPGRLSMASNGEGGFPHMTIELMRVQGGGFKYLHVPYKGSADIATQLIGGHVDAAIDGVSGLVPHFQSGKLRLLAVTVAKRVPQYPDTPTIAEALPGYESSGWFGWVAPANTPRDIVTKLNQEINRAMFLPDIKEKMIALGLNPVGESPEFFGKAIRDDHAKYGKLIRDIGFQPQ